MYKSFNNNQNCIFYIGLDGEEISKEKKSELLEKYYQKIIKDFTTTNIFNNTKDITLLKMYIEPRYKILISQTTLYDENNTDRFISISNNSIHTFFKEYLPHNKLSNELDLSLKLKNANIILLLGQPGQGKTSLSKKFMYDSIQNKKIKSPNYFKIKLRDIGQVDNFLEDPIETISSKLNIILSFTPNFHEETILFLDGLDELAMKEKLITEAIDNFLQTLIIKTKDFPNLKIILTSRTHYVNIEKLSKKLKNDILTLHLQPFSLKQQIDWVNKYKTFNPNITMSKELLIQLHNEDHLYILELIAQPILLHMITELNMTHNELIKSSNRATIYQKLFDSIIQRKWDNRKEHENLKGLEPNDIRELLQTIAFEIFKSDYEYIHRTKLENLSMIKEFYKNLDIDLNDVKKLDNILKGVLISFYFQEVKKDSADNIDDNGNYAIEFIHKSLQEYLVAEKIFHEIINITKRYVQNDYTSSIEFRKILYKLFASRKISDEIRTYLIDIIKNSSDTKTKLMLSQMLQKLLPNLFLNDFLNNYNLEDNNPIEKSLNIFYGFWTIISQLSVAKNYISPIFKPKFEHYLSFLNTSNNNIQYLSGVMNSISLDLSFQELSKSYLPTLCFSNNSLIHIHLNNSYLVNTIFSNCNLVHGNLSFSNLKDSDFSESNLQNTNFQDTFCINANFEKSDLTNANFDNAILVNARFVHAIFKNTKLNNIVIDRHTAEYLKYKGIKFSIGQLSNSNWSSKHLH